MSVLVYGPVRFQIQRTDHFSFSPVYSADGADYLYTEVSLGVTAVCNPQVLATNGPNAIAGPVNNGPAFLEDAPAQANGDSLGVTLRNLRAMLMTPRQALSFSIGGDNVISIPAGGDAKNGPLPQPDTYVRQIIGTKTCLIHFSVKAWVVDFMPGTGNSLSTLPHVVLSNRFRVTSVTDENWYSRRHVVGQMIVDAGAMRSIA